MHTYLKPLDKLFRQHADGQRAASMKKYMKGQFEYFGIQSPVRRSIVKVFYQKFGLPNEDILEELVKDCWEMPYRDYQYVAMELLQKFATKAEVCRIDLYEYMVFTKSWWDTVDFIASNLAGTHFQRFPDTIGPYTEKWMVSGNMWLQRTAILFQLKYKKDTDLQLLDNFIKQLQGSKEFFINKAIGWILREYSKTDAVWVKHYVDQNAETLAPLSKREALKWMERKGLNIVGH
ncbi:MAG: DNA alkylation repair protein [Bacteroidales bacterium]|nr:DNA alkylation repair protein [Bacteroidales bacterium]